MTCCGERNFETTGFRYDTPYKSGDVCMFDNYAVCSASDCVDDDPQVSARDGLQETPIQ